MSRRKHLYRVTATWSFAPLPDGTRPADTVRVWHYQSKAAADHRAAVLREGRPALGSYDHLNGPTGEVAAIVPATVVTVERSEAVVWPEAPAAPAPLLDGPSSPQQRAARAAGAPSPVPEGERILR